MGTFLEIKSRTWSRKDADLKAELTSELLNLLGVGQCQNRDAGSDRDINK
jgi:hypothetical protein